MNVYLLFKFITLSLTLIFYVRKVAIRCDLVSNAALHSDEQGEISTKTVAI